MKRRLAWGFVLLVAIAQHDFWFWDDPSLVFGFLPIGLAWQALVCLLAACGWLLVVRLAWPEHLEEWADQGATEADAR